MTFEWVGIITLAIGCLSLVSGRRFAIVAFLLSTLLGAASAGILTALGGANLPPAQVLLGFLLVRVLLSWRRELLAEALAWPRAGFWLLLTVVYGVVAAIFMPRLFANDTYVFTFARTDAGTGLLLVPLGPVTGNVTQTVYFIGDLAAYCVVWALACDARGRLWFAQGLIACAVADLVFAGLDYATFLTGTADYLAVLRNAPYRMLDTAEVIGIKRLVGSFPEASAFASATLCLFAFTLSLWLRGCPSRLPGPLALLLAGALIASTSTTAYAGLAAYLALAYLAAGLRVVAGSASRAGIAFLATSPLALAAVACAIALNDPVATFIGDALNQLVFLKGSTASAVERSSWNAQAMTNFLDSYGLGIGIGSARASNVALAVLAAVGVFGAATYAMFALTALTAPYRDEPDSQPAIREAAASACAAFVIGGLLAGTTIDLGLTFFVCAALAAAPVPERVREETPEADPQPPLVPVAP